MSRTKEELEAELKALEEEELKKALGEPIPLVDAKTGSEPVKEIIVTKEISDLPPLTAAKTDASTSSMSIDADGMLVIDGKKALNYKVFHEAILELRKSGTPVSLTLAKYSYSCQDFDYVE
jgi:hypothetical protein